MSLLVMIVAYIVATITVPAGQPPKPNQTTDRRKHEE